jgi:hypothetical protein
MAGLGCCSVGPALIPVQTYNLCGKGDAIRYTCVGGTFSRNAIEFLSRLQIL